YREDGTLEQRLEYSEGQVHGKTKKVNTDGQLVRESNYRNGKEIDINYYYLGGELRLKTETEKNCYTHYGKNGKKRFQIYFEFEKNNDHINIRPGAFSNKKSKEENNLIYDKSSDDIWGQVGVGFYSPFGVWSVYDLDGNKIYQLNFNLIEKFGKKCGIVIKENLETQRNKVSSEVLYITGFYRNLWNTIADSKIFDSELSLLDDILKTEVLRIDQEKLKPFIQSTKNPFIYAFQNEYCGEKLIYQTMMLKGGIDSFIKTEEKIGSQYKTVWENEKTALTLEYKTDCGYEAHSNVGLGKIRLQHVLTIENKDSENLVEKDLGFQTRLNKFCTKCGAKHDRAKFCTNCGNKIA
ncbi:hypothetical protein N9V42_05380, partial [Flavobacteriaceae bacterium]|nr:hypothetical protein [Flavobacteriaceae bacterium]